MNRYLLVALALITSVALADARIETGPNGYNNKGENTAHFPYDSDDTDNEFYSSAGLEITAVQEDGRSSAIAKHVMVIKTGLLPDAISPYGANIRVDNETTGETCTIEANGTTYVAEVWNTTITRPPGYARPVTMVTECYDGVAQ